MEATASPQEAIRFKLNVGDVLITKDSEDWQDIAIPALIDETAADFVCGYHLGIIRSGPMADSAFMFRAMQSVSVNRQLQTSASGVTRYGLPNAAVGDVILPIPPLDEQRAIAAFLDRETQRIDAHVDKKRRLIERLQEYRTALITRTVTRGLPPEAARAAGLDPNVRLKPSGVEWLGDVPAHWEVLALKRLGTFKSGAGFPIEQQGQQGQEIPFFKVSDMNLPGNDRFMDTWNNSVSRSTAAKLKATIFPTGTIVFPKVGGAMLTNKRRVLIHPSCIDNNLMGCIVTRGDPHFALLLLRHIDLAVITKPGPVPAISEGEVGEIRVVFPPLPEQAAIVDYLDKAAAGIDAAIARARRQIDLIQEYRTALITAAVTGKIDVRKVPSDPVAATAV